MAHILVGDHNYSLLYKLISPMSSAPIVLNPSYRSIKLDEFTQYLNGLLSIDSYGPDVVFSEFMPKVYTAAGIKWGGLFEPRFEVLFNGLMIRGAAKLSGVFLSAFPSVDVLKSFLGSCSKGDVLFCHHPIDYRSGSSINELGEGFVPLMPHWIDEFRAKQVSLYCCHAPLDFDPVISTTRALSRLIGAVGEPSGKFCGIGNHTAGLVVTIPECTIPKLCNRLQRGLGLNRLDTHGVGKIEIKRVAIVAGEAARRQFMEDAASIGADVYVAGEVFSYVKGEWGDTQRSGVTAFLSKNRMPLIGVSHGASELYVLRTDLANAIQRRFGIVPQTIVEQDWWR